ncbi:YvrJ protein family protein [Desulfofundulus australicus DSM 11792]|uniref:YvrJ protein family protein n=1 Tax=Desulfofundulus australicus DSM 11792 TaxID=1121425 RepID=A0A1M4WNK7_9FIRM|nr:YvrJ protein family protein [Desulfofundulus australicus DSM 11792]
MVFGFSRIPSKSHFSPLTSHIRRCCLVETILQAVGNLGFPIVVTAYLLVRIEARLENLAASIAGLAQAVNALRK